MKVPDYLTVVAARALVAAVGIVPVTIGGIALIRCGCSPVAWTLEFGTAVLYLVWIFLPRPRHESRTPMRSKLLLAAQALAICAVIGVLAWSKSHGVTAVIPYFPHRRNETSLTVRRTRAGK